MEPPWTVNGGQWRLSSRPVLAHPTKRPRACAGAVGTLGGPHSPDPGRDPGDGEMGRGAAPNHLGSAGRGASALAPGASASSSVDRGGDQLLSPLPAPRPVRDAPPPLRGARVPPSQAAGALGAAPTPRAPKGAGPRPVLTPAAAAAVGTRDFSAPRVEPDRLRPLSCRLRNSLDRSKESVERLCSSRLLRRTTIVSRCRSRNPL